MLSLGYSPVNLLPNRPDSDSANDLLFESKTDNRNCPIAREGINQRLVRAVEVLVFVNKYVVKARDVWMCRILCDEV
jgi:hypothetical protein